jgi:large subunit ribosomal protein L10
VKKIGLLIKETQEHRIKNYLKESSAVLIVKYSGISSPDLSALRQSLKNSNAHLLVVKNSVAQRAISDSGLVTLIKSIEGPCGFIFVKNEPVDASRTLYNFSKEHEQLKIEGGIFKDRNLDKKDIEAISRLPSKEVLRAQVVISLNSLIYRLAIVLNQGLRKFVYCLEQVRQKKTNLK